MTSYEICDLELKSEDILRNKRTSVNWKRRQELKLKDNTEVLDGRKLPRKKATKKIDIPVMVSRLLGFLP